jgi:hypothetical protein
MNFVCYIRHTEWADMARILEVVGSGTSAILPEVFLDFPQFLQTNAGIVLRVRQDSFVSNLLVILPFSTKVHVLTAMLNKPPKYRSSTYE